MARLLDTLYRVDEVTPYLPGEIPPEIVDSELTARQSAGEARHRSGQGFRLSVAEKLAIEKHAVRLVTEHYAAPGFKVTDVGATESFDLSVTVGSVELSVEVKGTTSLGEEVILTHNEVEHHRANYPHNALAIVHLILLDRTADSPIAYGGTLVIIQPWAIADDDLKSVSYRYTTSLNQWSESPLVAGAT